MTVHLIRYDAFGPNFSPLMVLTPVRKVRYSDERGHTSALLSVDYLQSSPLSVIMTWCAAGVCTMGLSESIRSLSGFSCGRLFCCRFCCLIVFSSFHVFLLSLTFVYLLLISEEIALILLSRSCFMVASSVVSAWDLRYPASELTWRQLTLFK